MRKQKDSLSDTAYTLIKESIVSCELEPGQFIAQAELAEKHGLGITPVREALRRLAQEGFLRALPRIGYEVSPVTPRDVQEIFEMRLALEVASARLAAARAGEGALEQLAQAADFTYTFHNRRSYARFLAQNTRFHAQVAALSGNQRLAAQVAKLMDELTRVFHLGLDLRDSAEEMRRDHLALVEALKKRDPALAEACIRDEILRSRERVLEAISRYPNIPQGDLYAEHAR